MRIAIIDSGIHDGHPHVGRVAGAIHFTAGGIGSDPIDRLGHGTAVAGAIREKVPAADLFAVKVFDRRLSAHIAAIVRALVWCREEGMDVINMSLGTSNPDHRAPLLEAIAENGLVVSAADLYPGGLAGVVSVVADEACPRGEFRRCGETFVASPYPRPVPGVPPERNLHGVSFAVANMTGFVARALDSAPRERLMEALAG